MAAKLYNTREEKLAARRISYQKKRDQALAYAAKYRAENKEKIKASTAGKHAEYSARYRSRNPDKCRQMTQAWKEAHPEQRKATQAKYLQNNYGRHLANIHNRRARKKSAGGEISKGLAERLYFLQRGRCACCGKSLKKGYELDHIIPLVIGGSNTDDNIQLLTPFCNRSKGGKDPIQFMQKKRGMLL